MTSEIRIIVITAGSRLSGVPMADRKKASPIPGSAKTVLIQVMTGHIEQHVALDDRE